MAIARVHRFPSPDQDETEQHALMREIIEIQQEIAVTQLDVEHVMKLIAERVMGLTRAEGASVELTDGDELVFRAAAGVAAPQIGLRMRIDSSLSGLAVLKSEVLRCNDARTDPRVDREACLRLGVRSIVAAPLRFNDRNIGAIQVMSRAPAAFGDREQGTLELLGGLLSAALGHAEDFGEKQRAQNKSMNLARELEARVAQRTADLEALTQRLGEAVRSRDEFLSIASHELKTPLTSLKLQNENSLRRIARGDYSACVPQTMERILRDYRRQFNRLVRLVDEMLMVATISSGRLKMRHEHVDLTEIIHEIVERYSPLLQQAGNSVSIEAAPELIGDWDRDRLEQILSNLLTNAIQYAKGSPIQIIAERAGSSARLTVADRGSGIAPEHHARIFERFERAISADEVSGMGLGLFISREIARAHGGDIRVESEPGRGARFTVELPFERALAKAHSSR